MKFQTAIWFIVSGMLFGFIGFSKKNKLPLHFPERIYHAEQYTEDQISLGKKLFYDPILSADSTISCATCHNPYNSFAHSDHRLSHGIQDRIGNRNAPPLFNLEWKKSLMWDGAANHPEVQPIVPITHPDEMGETLEHVIIKLNNCNRYLKEFQKAFSTNHVTGQFLLKAIAAFQLSLRSYESKYDLWKNDKLQFSDQEKKGYQIFLKHCNSCHTEPLFTNDEFASNGLTPDDVLKDYGRIRITGNTSDSLLFKIPSLRNLKYTSPYMHDGRYKKLREVINHYENNILHHPTLSSFLEEKIILDDLEETDLIAFINTLNDSSFVFNRDYQPN